MGESRDPSSCTGFFDGETGRVAVLELAKDGGRAAADRAAETEAEGAKMFAFFDLGFFGVLHANR